MFGYGLVLGNGSPDVDSGQGHGEEWSDWAGTYKSYVIAECSHDK